MEDTGVLCKTLGVLCKTAKVLCKTQESYLSGELKLGLTNLQCICWIEYLNFIFNTAQQFIMHLY